MEKVSIRFDASAVFDGEFVHGFYGSLGLDPSACLESQAFENKEGTRVKLFGMEVPIPEELRPRSEWMCRLIEQGDAVVFVVNDFAWAASLREAGQAGIEAARLPTDIRTLDLQRPSTESLQCLGRFPLLESVNISGCKDIADLTLLAGLSSLRNVTLRSCKFLSGLQQLSSICGLSRLALVACNAVEDLGPLAGLADLKTLRLSRCDGICSLKPLAMLQQLERLDVSECAGINDLGPLQSLSGLKSLLLSRCDSVSRLDPLTCLVNLENLEVSYCTQVADLGPLSSLRQLRCLDLTYSTAISRLQPLSVLANLSSLSLVACDCLVELGPLASLQNLQELDLSGCLSVTDITPLACLRSLTRLDLGGCRSLEEFGPLASLENLQQLDLSSCWSVTDLNPLSSLHKLVGLDVSFCSSLRDISALSGLTNLTSLKLAGCKSLSDVSALSGLTNLTSLDFGGCDGMRSLAPLAGLRSLQVFRFTSRRISSIEPLRAIAAIREFEGFNPPEVAELLSHAAVLRGDGPFILKNSTAWLMEATVWQDAPRGMLNRFAATLGDAFTLLGESPIDSPYEDFISRRPEFTSAPWKAWFGGTLKESGFDLYRSRVERVPLVEMTSGAIGGACLTLPLQEHMDWSRQWLADLEKSCLGDAKTLLPVAPEICLAYARSGDRQALRRWLEAFTDPSDPAALDPVHAALARFQIGVGALTAAGNHAHAIHSPAMRDPILGELVVHLAESDEDLASASLLLIEDQVLRIDLAKKLAAKSSASEVLIHRCIVAAGESPQAVADLISALPQTSRSELIVQLSKKLQTDRKTMLLGIAGELERQARLLRAKAASEPASA